MRYAMEEAGKFLRSYHFETGCAREAATYQLVSLGYIMLLAAAVRNAGGSDLFTEEPAIKKSFTYLASTQTPRDPRCGFSMLPTIGHVTSGGWCQALQAYFAWAARATVSTDPAFSRRMMAAWRRAGSMPISLHDWANDMIWWQPLCFIDRSLPEEDEPDHDQSRLHEGLGAIFRTAHETGPGSLPIGARPSGGRPRGERASGPWVSGP